MFNIRISGVDWLLYYSVSTPLVDTFSEVVSTRFKGVSLILSSNEVSAICCMITMLIYIVFTPSSSFLTCIQYQTEQNSSVRISYA